MTEREKFTIIISNEIVKPSDAIIYLEGDGDNRVNKVIELYKNGFGKYIVFSGGVNNVSSGCYPYTNVVPLFLKSGIEENKIIGEIKSQNTKEQAGEVIKLCIKHNWKRIIIVASHYHQYRAYLTFLKAIIENGCDILIYNSPAKELEWFTETGWGKRIELLEQEFEKIEIYTAKGDLASYTEAINYQKWKEEKI